MQRSRHVRRRRTAWYVASMLLATVAAACGAGARGPGAQGPPVTTAPGPGGATAASGTAPGATTPEAPSTTGPSADAPASLAAALPSVGDGALPQTDVLPPSDGPQLQAEGALLWDAVQAGDATIARRSFFPAAAYLQVKAVADPAADFAERLVGHFDLDVAAVHSLLGAGASGSTFVAVLLPPSGQRFILPGQCTNRIGYWHLGGARLVYREGAVEASVGIASLISWRGAWYVVHLGSVTPPAGRGVVDLPAAGVGQFGPTGGC